MKSPFNIENALHKDFRTSEADINEKMCPKRYNKS